MGGLCGTNLGEAAHREAVRFVLGGGFCKKRQNSAESTLAIEQKAF